MPIDLTNPSARDGKECAQPMGAAGANSPKFAWIDLLLVAVVAAFALVLTYVCGRRGFFALDQSIVFDGGYRIAGGQVIYRDFVAPCGVLVFWIQGLVFKVFGVSMRVYILTAAVFDAAAAVGAYLLVKRLCKRTTAWALGGMLITAAWFYPISGTPFMENTGFAFVLAAMLLAIPRKNVLTSPRIGWPSFLAGATVLAAFLCKQNVGMYASPIVLLTLVVTRVDSLSTFFCCVTTFSAGIATAAAGFLAWVFTFSNFANFIKFFFVVPSKEGGTRVSLLIHFWLRHGPAAALGGGFNDSIQILLGVCGAVNLLIVILAYFKREDHCWRSHAVASAISLGLMFVQSAFALTTNNESENALPFLGIIVAVTAANAYRLLNLASSSREKSPNDLARFRISGFVGSAMRTTSVSTRPRGQHETVRNADPTPIAQNHLATHQPPPAARRLSAAVCAASILAITGWGVFHGYFRTMQDTVANAQFEAARPGFVVGEFLWPRITKREQYQVRREDCDEVIRFVKSQPDNMFVVGDWKILYAAAGRTSADPFLWYHQGLTYPSNYDASIDAWMVRNLQEKNVGVVIVEHSGWLTRSEFDFEDFRQFREYVQTHYRSHMTGIFEVYVRQGNDPISR